MDREHAPEQKAGVDTPGKTFQILALDGGGIKGLFSAAILAAIEADLKISITNHFDLITGTSTGGIIALGLGLGMRPSEIVHFYVQEGPSIFGNRFGWRGLLQWVYRKFPQERLKAALQRHFGEKLLSESRKRLVIPSWNLDEEDVYLFKTPHHERLRRDYKVPIWQVALATSAAPTYFPACQGIDHMRLIDGGVWANNPTMVAVVEAYSMLGIPLNTIRVLSLGTSDSVVKRPKCLTAGGFFQWRKAATDVILRGQSRSAYTQALHLLGKDGVTRLDPKVPDALFALDKLCEKELLAKAAHESRILTPAFAELFLPHIAPEYKPLYINSTKKEGTK